MTTTLPTQSFQVAQARAAAYGLIAFGLHYPDGARVRWLADPAHWTGWPDVLATADERIEEPLQAVRQAVRAEADALTRSASGEPCELQQRHDDVFGHAVRGKCPAYEMEYGRHEIIRQAADLADLAGFYRAFGFELADGAEGRPDHIAAECEFLGALCAKEAHALSLDEGDHVDVCVNAQRAFLKDHLARWLPALARRIEEADAEGLYGALARLASVFVGIECEQFDIQAGPPTLELKPPDPVLDQSIDCAVKDCRTNVPGDQLVQLDVDSGFGRER